ncbi:MAG: hypothetical protein ACJAS1_007511 [Oleiphilaceae bacterium]|jgi:hypothetical protein
MKRAFQVLSFFVFTSFGSYAYELADSNIENVLLGQWVFNNTETVENFKNSSMSEAEFKKFSSILKPAKIVITDKFYSSKIQGRKPTQTPYSIISISDNGECYKLQLEDPRIPLDIQKLEVCVVNNRLLLPSVKGSKEVFNKKL